MRVLLVEDNPGDAFIARRCLAPHDIHWADCLESALAAVDTFEPHVVVLDLGLPDSQGIDTFQRLRTVFSTGPVIVLTGNANEAIKDGVLAAGAAALLTKTVQGRQQIPEVLAGIAQAQ